MSNVIQNIGYYKINDTFTVKYDAVFNSCVHLVKNKEVTIEVPPGLVLDSYDIPTGTFSILDNTWTIPLIVGKKGWEALFTFKVLSDCYSSFLINFLIDEGDDCQDCFNLPNYCVEVRGLSCCSLLPCLEGLATNVNKFVTEGLNVTEVNVGASLVPTQIIAVMVNSFEVDYQDDALTGFMSYVIEDTKIKFSEPVTGTIRVKYLTLT